MKGSNHESPKQQEKAATGIAGFDQGTGGGFPRGRTSLIIGGPGTGKTIFALQTLVHGASQGGEPGIFVAFEENARQIAANAASFGWDLPSLEKDRLFFLDARMSINTVTAGQFDLAGLLASLEAKAEAMGARRIAFDSIDVLLTLLDDPVLERREVYRIHDWLSQAGLTGIVTTRIGRADPLHSDQYGFMQFMADCVVLLTHRLENRVSLRSVRTVKYRGSAFAENESPLVIGPQGIEIGIAQQIEPAYEVSTERASTGIERLDTMLSGGYYRGSSTLISGAPGTAKSTLCGAFLLAACQRGERALYVTFDESASEIVRNMASISVDMAPYLDSGLLEIYAARAEARSADQHMMRLKARIRACEPRCLVIDPISAMNKAGGSITALSMAERLLSLTKSRGITVLLTTLLAGDSPEVEAASLAISTIADTWIHLSYVVKAGERNRSLTIVKSRGTAHSNQVRELVLSDEGISLADVYTAGGEVPIGTLRWEKEEEAKIERVRKEAELKRKEAELALAEAEAQARMQAIKREIAAVRAETELLQQERQHLTARWVDTHESLRHLRKGDSPARDPGEETPDLPLPPAGQTAEVE